MTASHQPDREDREALHALSAELFARLSAATAANPEARELLASLRELHDAVLTGVGSPIGSERVIVPPPLDLSALTAEERSWAKRIASKLNSHRVGISGAGRTVEVPDHGRVVEPLNE
jgi:hypothetical protein